MVTLLLRAWLCPMLLAILVISPLTSAVDPIDFLESLKDDEQDTSFNKDSSSSTEYPNGVNVIPGEAEVNYPVYSSIPKSSFSCIGRPVGFYADTELRCQVWHICDEDRRQQSFLCTNGTVYSQEKRVCDWWYNVNCDPNEVSRNYLQNYDLYKGPPSKSANDQEQNNGNSNNNNNNKNNEGGNQNSNNRNDFDYQPTTKSNNKDPFSQFPSSRQAAESQQKPRFNTNNNDQQYSKPTPSYNEPFPTRDSSFSNNNNNNDFPSSSSRRQQPQTRPTTTSTTTYRPPTTYNTPPPPAALQGSSFPPKQQQHHQRSHQPQQQSQQQQKQQSQQQQQKNSAETRLQPSIKTTNTGGKRIVEIRVPISQIPPEILAKYGKRIPENILKEIFLNFTKGQQQNLQKDAIANAKPSNPTGAGNSRTPPPSSPIPQSRQSSSNSQPPPSKKPVDFGGNSNSNNNNNNNNRPSFSGNSNPPPPPPPPPAESHNKFRHSTPRKVDNVKFATPTRELLAEYDDERQLVGESQNPIYSLQQLFSSQHSRTSAKSKANLPLANEGPRLKESFNFEATSTTTTTPQPYQEFTRSQPRRRTQSPTTTQRTTTTEEPRLITDRYFPVASKEEKKNAEIRRIFLVAKQGIKVLPPIPVLSGAAAEEAPTPRRQPPPIPVTQRTKILRTTPIPDFSRIPPLPKVSIPEDYYIQNERFEEAESRYPRPSIPPTYTEPHQFQSSRQHSRPTTTTTKIVTTTTTTTTPPPPPTPFYQEPEIRRTKPSKPQQSRKKPLPPPEKKEENSDDYDDGSNQDRTNTDELELLRLAQEYIELTGQDFGVKTSRNA